MVGVATTIAVRTVTRRQGFLQRDQGFARTCCRASTSVVVLAAVLTAVVAFALAPHPVAAQDLTGIAGPSTASALAATSDGADGLADAPRPSADFSELAQAPPAPSAVGPSGGGAAGDPASGPSLTIGQLIFVGGQFETEAAVRRGQAGISQGSVSVVDLPLLEDPEFRARILPYIGQTFRGDDIAVLNEVLTEVISFLRERNRPVVDALIPAQDFGGARTGDAVPVIIQMVEGRVGNIAVEENAYFADEQIAGGVRANNAGEIDSAELAEDLRFINYNPFRTVDLIYRPGPTVGSTDIVLRTRDSLPLRVFSTYANNGSPTTGFDRYSFGVNTGDLFALGHQLDYQWTIARDPETFNSHFVAYTIPLPWFHLLRLSASLSDTEAQLDEFLRQESRNLVIQADYTVPLPQAGEVLGMDLEGLQHEVVFGINYKRLESELLFGGTLQNRTEPEIFQLSARYQGTYRGENFITSGNLGLVASPGNVTDENTNEAFQAARAFSQASYVYVTGALEHTQLLGNSDFSLVGRARGQLASTNLQSSEQISIAGEYAVRAFEEGAYSGDSGFVLNAELLTPTTEVLSRAFDITDPVFGNRVRDSLQGVVFLDYGYADVHSPVDTDPHPVSIAAAGVGLRYNIFPWLSVRADYGFELDDFAGDGTDERLHVQVVVGN